MVKRLPHILRYPLIRQFYLIAVFVALYKRDKSYIREELQHIQNHYGLSVPIIKVWKAVVIDHWLPKEFFCYKYYLRTPKERTAYVLNWEKNLFSETVNPTNEFSKLDNKYLAYKTFREYYKREVLLFSPGDNSSPTIDRFRTFISSNRKVVLKPIETGSGKGIVLLEDKSIKSYQALFDELIIKNPWGFVLEEYLVQDERLANFHPSSLNTIRMPAIRTTEGIALLNPFLRIGTSYRFLDNIPGSIYASIDIYSGIITNAAMDSGEIIKEHPNTSIVITGVIIPEWEAAKKLIIELMDIVPSFNYVSWDIALTNKGWALIEGNPRGQFFGQQIPIQKGIRDIYKVISRKIRS